MNTPQVKVMYMSPAYARMVELRNGRKATAMFLDYVKYRADFAQSSAAAFMNPVPYRNYLAMWDYYPYNDRKVRNGDG